MVEPLSQPLPVQSAYPVAFKKHSTESAARRFYVNFTVWFEGAGRPIQLVEAKSAIKNHLKNDGGGTLPFGQSKVTNGVRCVKNLNVFRHVTIFYKIGHH